jgi:DNA-binding protein YbaB
VLLLMQNQQQLHKQIAEMQQRLKQAPLVQQQSRRRVAVVAATSIEHV